MVFNQHAMSKAINSYWRQTFPRFPVILICDILVGILVIVVCGHLQIATVTTSNKNRQQNSAMDLKHWPYLQDFMDYHQTFSL